MTPPADDGEAWEEYEDRYLAAATQGVYQVDDQGFFSPDGTLLLQEY